MRGTEFYKFITRLGIIQAPSWAMIADEFMENSDIDQRLPTNHIPKDNYRKLFKFEIKENMEYETESNAQQKALKYSGIFRKPTVNIS